MHAFVCRFAVAGIGAALSIALSTSSAAAEPATSCKQLTHVQRRVVEKADQGVDALRQYIFITRGIRQLDMMEIASTLDAWRAIARCIEVTDNVAGIAPAAELTAQAAF